MQGDGHIRAQEGGIGHVAEQRVAGGQVGAVLVHGLAQVIDQVLVHIGADDDQALHAEGIGVIVLTGVGAGGDLRLDVSGVAGQDAVDLFLGVVQNDDVLGGGEVQLAADGQTGEAEGRVDDAVAHGVSAVAQAQVLQAGVVGVDVHDSESVQAGVLSGGGGGADSHALALQIVDILQTGTLQRHAAGDGGVNSADDADIVQSLGELALAGVALQNNVGGGDGHVNFAGGHVLHVLEGTGGGLGVALHTVQLVGPDLGQSSAGGIQGAAGITGAESQDGVAVGGLGGGGAGGGAAAAGGGGAAAVAAAGGTASAAGQEGCGHQSGHQNGKYFLHCFSPLPLFDLQPHCSCCQSGPQEYCPKKTDKGMVIPLDIHPLVVPSKIYYTPASFAITIFSHVGFLWRMTDVG